MPEDQTTTETPPAETPAEFNWTQKMPDNRPDVFGKYENLGAAADAHKSLQGEFTRKSEEAKALRAELDALKTKPTDKPAKGTDKPAAPAEETLDLPAEEAASKLNETWMQARNTYLETGTLSPDIVADLSVQTGMAQSDVLDLMEKKKHDRESFIANAKDAVPGVEMEALEAWFKSGESGYPAEALAGFEALANRGNLDWVRTAWQDFQTFRAEGKTFTDPRTGKMFGAATDQLHGNPPGFDPPGFRSRDEYQAAYTTAKLKASQDGGAAKRVVAQKLAETPEHIKAGWF
jgi:hypothetical protein